MLIGYARVSRMEGQDTITQIAALKSAGAAKLFEDRASGGRWDRPQLHQALAQLRPGDVFIVWKLDRLSRSLKDLLHLMELIEAAGAGFRSLTEAIDTTTPAGRMLMQLVGSFAEFERAMIRERTKAGLETARQQGRIGGPSSRRTRKPRPWRWWHPAARPLRKPPGCSVCIPPRSPGCWPGIARKTRHDERAGTLGHHAV